jgi:hypothetical protein
MTDRELFHARRWNPTSSPGPRRIFRAQNFYSRLDHRPRQPRPDEPAFENHCLSSRAGHRLPRGSSPRKPDAASACTGGRTSAPRACALAILYSIHYSQSFHERQIAHPDDADPRIVQVDSRPQSGHNHCRSPSYQRRLPPLFRLLKRAEGKLAPEINGPLTQIKSASRTLAINISA